MKQGADTVTRQSADEGAEGGIEGAKQFGQNWLTSAFVLDVVGAVTSLSAANTAATYVWGGQASVGRHERTGSDRT